MKKNLIVIVFLISTLPFNAATKLNGFVENDYNGTLVFNAKVTLNDSIYVYTDIRGFYSFDIYSIGTYKIKIEQIKFIEKSDSIVINNLSKNYRYVATLKPKPLNIKVPISLWKYHNYFNNKSPNNVLELKIDSLKYGTRGLELYSSILNKTDSTIYLLRDFKLNNRINRYIKNSKGELVSKNTRAIDFFQSETIFGVTVADVVIIKPKEKQNYPVILFPFNRFSDYPKDKYRIKIEYEYSEETKDYALSHLKPSLLSEDQSVIFNVALVGKFEATNEIIFDNSEYVR